MTCTIHPEMTAVAYCRACGKALCESCKRDVRGVIYCEDCLAARLHGAVPEGAAAAAPSPAPAAPPVVVSSGPSPGLAGVLAGIFPFGVGAVYNGLYLRGLMHLIIFVMLVGALDSGVRPQPVFGLAMAFYYIYQIVDAVRCARALRLHQQPPDPFGLGRVFGSEQPSQMSNIPVGAIVLIGLGVLFLLGNMGLLHLHAVSRFWPLILIGIGVWLFARRLGMWR